jgi:hypothetical protein
VKCVLTTCFNCRNFRVASISPYRRVTRIHSRLFNDAVSSTVVISSPMMFCLTIIASDELERTGE